TLVVGPQFEESITALRIVAVVCVTALPDALLFFVLVALGREVAATICLVATVVTNIILDIILIPIMGVPGACLGTIGAEWTYFALALLLVHRTLRISSFWQFIGKPVAAGAAMALAVWMAGPHQPVLGALTGLAAFAFLLVLLRVRPRESLRTLRAALAVRPAEAAAGAEQPLPASNSEYE
ncbi:MAG: polysaccharide biosynthesis C-terminal domain-containing protein, partial [Armatimonadota bacterium]